MCRLFLVAALLLTGCQNIVGPFQQRRPMRVDDPCVSVAEQERRGRDRLALPQDRTTVGPPTELQPPDAPYRGPYLH
ncbi:MAG TPA: hypothetical protein VG013_11045 [Gemmataceae bacterium]|jgi:hypothetical protein|nr:hypothetical protein [Gemmataceae bacterium]